MHLSQSVTNFDVIQFKICAFEVFAVSDKNDGRYAVSPNEDYEPGSNDQAFKNFLGVTSKEKIEQIEEQELKRTALE